MELVVRALDGKHAAARIPYREAVAFSNVLAAMMETVEAEIVTAAKQAHLEAKEWF